MRRAFNKQDMAPVAQALLARAEADQMDANAYLDFAITLQLTGDRDVAMDVQAEAVRIRPHYTLPARQGEMLRLLVIMGLGDLMANTPIEFLLEDSDVTLEFLYVTADAPWPDVVPEHDVMMVCMGENDVNQPLLARLSEWIAGWPRPVINGPDRIAVLSRDGVCNALCGIDGVEMPQTVRLSREQLAALAAAPDLLRDLLPDGAFPLIVRPLGSHAGHDLDKIDTPAVLAAYLERVPAERFYLSRFVDYRGANGLFGKYRVVLVEGVPYLAHFASSEHWMVHYLNAGMGESEAKRALEAEAMAQFDATFAARHRAALAEIDRRIGLSYVGMDCAETPDGKLLVFEVDNAMIVHAMDDEAMYPYKKPAMRKIFTAFRQLLENARTRR
ncbi:RimK family alpha-L-glutamate ligase [Pseudoduganella lutea]|uniref:RimK family alpha-L-glutamate ligase n=2 Tax=Pseudoduganella lutea TaxID=321985 RepID=A0A4P6L6V0_9BURK|nr:RimK family alpha-L-glutamate ligase [Pseudoduganella lutea]